MEILSLLTVTLTLILRFTVKPFNLRIKILAGYSILIGILLIVAGVSGDWASSDAVGMFIYALLIEGIIKVIVIAKNKMDSK